MVGQGKRPLFSLVIAVAPWRDAEILQSFHHLNYPKEQYEVIIEKGNNASRNRNQGVKKARGEIIAFLDDDAFIHPQLLKQAELFFKQYAEIDIVGGPQLTPENDSIFGKVSGYALGSRFGGWSISQRYIAKKLDLNTDETALTSANLFCRKSVFEKVQFREDLWPGEDPAFIADAKRADLHVAYHPGLIVYHRRRGSLKTLAIQVYHYGRTRPQKEAFIDTLKRPFFLVPSVFLVYIFSLALFLITQPILGFSSFSWLFSLALFPLGAYLFLLLASTLFLSGKHRSLSALFFLPLIFPTIHLSYGWGMLAGLFKHRFLYSHKD